MRLLLLAVLLAALTAPGAAHAQSLPPDADTRPAVDVAHRSATLVATVNPNGSATTYVFQYGTTAAYGLETEARPAGNGPAGVEVTAPVTELTPSTTYHVRVLATNENGTTAGADTSFTTAAPPPNPQVPRAFRLRVQANSPTAPVVQALVNPRGAATTWRVEYGHTPAYGLATPEQPLPAGTEDVPVSASLTGLEPGRRVFWRVVATNAAGIKRSGRARFTTQRAPAGVTIALEPATVPWGATLAVRGQVLGQGVGGITVALQRLPFPFGAPFADAATTRADRAGRFAFLDVPLLLTTRFQVQARAAVPAQSEVLTAYSTVVVTVGTGTPRRRRVPVGGTVRPAVPSGRAALQRAEDDGTWRTVRRARLADLASYSRFRFAAPRLRRTRSYRVVVSARDGGAHLPGTSRTIRVRARRPAARRPDRDRRRPRAGAAGSSVTRLG